MLKRFAAITSAALLGTAGMTVCYAPPAAADAPCSPGKNGFNCNNGGQRQLPGGDSGGSGGGDGGGGGGGGNPCDDVPGTPGGLACPGRAGDPAPAQHTPTVTLVESMRDGVVFPAPNINTAPSPRTYVQVPTYFWIDAAGVAPQPIDPLTVFDQTITATATATGIKWTFDDGRTLGCAGRAIFTKGPQCSHTYARSSAYLPGKAYQVKAATTWNVHWECSGNCDPGQQQGDFPGESVTDLQPLIVDEIQTGSQPG